MPVATATPATETAPKGRIIDDSARGTVFWEAKVDSDNEQGQQSADEAAAAAAEREEAEGGANSPQTFGKPFKITWMSTERLPFYRTRGLRNPWNSNREVKIARDGTELEPGVGRRLVSLFHRPFPVQPQPQPQPQPQGSGQPSPVYTRGPGPVPAGVGNVVVEYTPPPLPPPPQHPSQPPGRPF